MLKAYTITVLFGVIATGYFLKRKNEQAIFYHNQTGSSEEFVNNLDYEAPMAIDFDKSNRPYIINNTLVGHNLQNGVYQVATLRNNEWVYYSYKDELEEIFGNKLYINKDDKMYQGHNASRSCQLMIDDNDNLIALIDVMHKTEGDKPRFKSVVLYARDIGSDGFSGDFIVKDVIPNSATTSVMEVRNGFNDTKEYAPLFVFLKRQKGFPYKTPEPWAQKSYGQAYVLNGYFDRDELVFNEPVLLDSNIPGFSNHSGGESFAATKGDHAFITYTRHDSDPEKDPDGNNAGYIKKFNRKTNKFEVARKFLFEATPSFADGHSIPVIAIDQEGYLHIQSGAHANNPTGPFIKTKSKNKLDITAWEEAKNIGNGRTYSTLLIDNAGNMHSFFRAGNPYKLRYQIGDVKNGFTNDNGSLFVDQNSEDGYRVYYHHIVKDRKDRIFISWTPNSGADYETWDFRRVLAMSSNSGKTWKIATKQDFVEGF
ncbi:BNR-4 repeat-containing protein [Fulvivirgaceae bacterium BMA10]|uniref:BNR-4 repeat-containing protein n=1 Tax=Splendidivirga corallicola TaxID=3051826 RepID=A0ABT8KTU9_9BACT|nr:BNR-4 repeat-containing protein [Fulvivirgaceae bacterium BMA10]